MGNIRSNSSSDHVFKIWYAQGDSCSLILLSIFCTCRFPTDGSTMMYSTWEKASSSGSTERKSAHRTSTQSAPARSSSFFIAGGEVYNVNGRKGMGKGMVTDKTSDGKDRWKRTYKRASLYMSILTLQTPFIDIKGDDAPCIVHERSKMSSLIAWRCTCVDAVSAFFYIDAQSREATWLQRGINKSTHIYLCVWVVYVQMCMKKRKHVTTLAYSALRYVFEKKKKKMGESWGNGTEI